MVSLSVVTEFISENTVPYLRARGKKGFVTQFRELWDLYRRYDFIPYQYLKDQVFLKTRRDHWAFLPPLLVKRIQQELNPPDAMHLAVNKAHFHRRLVEQGIRTPECFLTTDRTLAGMDGKDRPLSAADGLDLLRSLQVDVFAKPVDGSLGRGCERIRASEIAANEFALRPKTTYQEVLPQHEAISAINPNAINTVRIDTTILDDEIHHAAAGLRIGVGTSVVDNIAAGGFCVGIELTTGRLQRYGYRYAKFGCGAWTEHPDTRCQFESVVIPDWSDVLATVQRAARALQPLGTLGWDVAITPDGPVLIEANPLWDVSVSQLGSGGIADTAIGRLAIQRQGRALSSQTPSATRELA